ncbi:unnamed protein product [Cylicostephanus goldi]|uniref:Uncharacterized protein n=1 Tax=Cylicostephanus goldi TaxID=71465 RepID=A0A3P6SM51_CYLGO|nr:unnamed protein product [Cylicostephanus goldi]
MVAPSCVADRPAEVGDSRNQNWYDVMTERIERVDTNDKGGRKEGGDTVSDTTCLLEQLP